CRDVDPSLFAQEEERSLHRAYESVRGAFLAKTRDGAYADALKKLAGLKEPIDTFFDKVLVMSEDEKVRNNRIALLANLLDLFGAMASFSKIST
ncbi:MAG TPA: DALR anticodon-binding domain-containing protein, partial [Deltaproteobacteria bacterium]|nr:DALR anticodon-binding domain-containing protein [Deltaproteobacteria bacterium]